MYKIAKAATAHTAYFFAGKTASRERADPLTLLTSTVAATEGKSPSCRGVAQRDLVPSLRSDDGKDLQVFPRDPFYQVKGCGARQILRAVLGGIHAT
jgi:hypothetical protein